MQKIRVFTAYFDCYRAIGLKLLNWVNLFREHSVLIYCPPFNDSLLPPLPRNILLTAWKKNNFKTISISSLPNKNMLYTSLTIYWPEPPSQFVMQYVKGILLACWCGLLGHRGLLGTTLQTHSSSMPTYVVANHLKKRNCGSKLRFKKLFNICVVLQT